MFDLCLGDLKFDDAFGMSKKTCSPKLVHKWIFFPLCGLKII